MSGLVIKVGFFLFMLGQHEPEEAASSCAGSMYHCFDTAPITLARTAGWSINYKFGHPFTIIGHTGSNKAIPLKQ
jgi:hypothetical protein